MDLIIQEENSSEWVTGHWSSVKMVSLETFRTVVISVGGSFPHN
jgi:hypothetical protein